MQFHCFTKYGFIRKKRKPTQHSQALLKLSDDDCVGVQKILHRGIIAGGFTLPNSVACSGMVCWLIRTTDTEMVSTFYWGTTNSEINGKHLHGLLFLVFSLWSIAAY